MGSLGWVSWLNLGGFVPGLALMYFTAFLVKFRRVSILFPAGEHVVIWYVAVLAFVEQRA